MDIIPLIEKNNNESKSCKSVLDPWHVIKKLMEKLPPSLGSINRRKAIQKAMKTHFSYCLRNCNNDPKIFLELWNNAPTHWFNNSDPNNDHSTCHERSGCRNNKSASCTTPPSDDSRLEQIPQTETSGKQAQSTISSNSCDKSSAISVSQSTHVDPPSQSSGSQIKSQSTSALQTNESKPRAKTTHKKLQRSKLQNSYDSDSDYDDDHPEELYHHSDSENDSNTTDFENDSNPITNVRESSTHLCNER